LSQDELAAPVRKLFKLQKDNFSIKLNQNKLGYNTRTLFITKQGSETTNK
jgi:hypothetical protein